MSDATRIGLMLIGLSIFGISWSPRAAMGLLILDGLFLLIFGWHT